MSLGICIENDGNGPNGLIWNCYSVDDTGKRTRLSPEWTREIFEPQVVVVERTNKQTKKKQKETRHMDVVIGTKRVTGESQSAALARAFAELKKQVTSLNKVRGVLLPAVAP
jgi:hypothetical protein